MKPLDVRLTELEMIVIQKIATNHFSDVPGDEIWASEINDSLGDDVPEASIPGIVSSLSRKGIVYCHGQGRNATVCLTPKGCDIWENISTPRKV